MQDEEKIIDVGEADYEETEVDLEAQPEPKEEPKEEVEVQQVEEAAPVETKKEELDDYSDSVNKRIAKLTRRMREAERQKEEAIQYAQSVNDEAQRLKTRFQNLDSNYTKEFEKRVTTNIEAAKSKLQNAINVGDVEAQTQANLELAELANDHSRLNRLKQMYDDRAKAAQPPAPTAPVQPPQPAAAPPPDPRADAWAAKNTWFGTDNAMTYTAFDIHRKLVEEGFDPNLSPDEYYSEVDKRIRLEFPHKFGNNESTTAEPVQTVASAKRPATKGRRKTVKLTPSQVAISKRLGVPLEEYAKQLAAKEV